MKIKSIAFALFTVLSVTGVAQTGVPRIVINAQGH